MTDHLEIHRRALRRFVFSRCRDRELTEDLVQSTFAAAWRKRDTQRCENTKTWLCTIALRLLLNYLRARRQQKRDAFELPLVINGAVIDVPDFSGDPARAVSAAAPELHQALRWLPDPERALVYGHYWQGLSLDELAAANKTTRSAIAGRLRRARLALKSYLSEPEALR